VLSLQMVTAQRRTACDISRSTRRFSCVGARQCRTDSDITFQGRRWHNLATTRRLAYVVSKPLPSPTLAWLGSALPEYGKFRFDLTLEAARKDIGSRPDLANPAHAARLREWLNQWTCRIGYPKPGEVDVLAGSLAIWWADARDMLPPAGQGLAQLTDAQLRALSRAYAGLYTRPAAVSRAGRIRGVGPTAAAKLMYFVRPLAITAWDKAISARTGGGQDEEAFLVHLTACRGWAQDLEAEARDLGLKPGEIGPYLDRPASSVAKLIDEWPYATITGGLGPSRQQQAGALPNSASPPALGGKHDRRLS
jgi:hypothetical protein